MEKCGIRFLAPANAVLRSTYVPVSAVHSVVMYSSGVLLWYGQAHPEYKDLADQVKKAGGNVGEEPAAMLAGEAEAMQVDGTGTGEPAEGRLQLEEGERTGSKGRSSSPTKPWSCSRNHTRRSSRSNAHSVKI